MMAVISDGDDDDDDVMMMKKNKKKHRHCAWLTIRYDLGEDRTTCQLMSCYLSMGKVGTRHH